MVPFQKCTRLVLATRKKGNISDHLKCIQRSLGPKVLISKGPKVQRSSDPKVWRFVKVRLSVRGAFPASRQWQWQWQWCRGQGRGRPRACNGSHPEDGSFSSSSLPPLIAPQFAQNIALIILGFFPAVSDMSFSKMDHNV